MNQQRGHTLLEVLVVLAILAVFSLVAGYAADMGMRQASLVAGTSDLRSVFHEVRMLAVARDRNLGIKFREAGGTWTWSVYEDRDGDGVRNDDIKKKVDREIRGPRRFDHSPTVIGVPPYDVRDPLKPGALLASREAVRFGTSTLCSFSRQGEATNGSIVLTDGVRARIIRVHGTTGRIDVFRWDGKKWRVGE
jgi:prepilin-type N-terminal cleavage/methylation domain-containing protein